MIALFFKNTKADHETEDSAVMQGQAALRNRMNHMLCEDAKLAWMPDQTHAKMESAVKKMPIRPRRFQFQIELA